MSKQRVKNQSQNFILALIAWDTDFFKEITGSMTRLPVLSKSTIFGISLFTPVMAQKVSHICNQGLFISKAGVKRDINP